MNIRRHTLLLAAIAAGFVLTYNVPSYGNGTGGGPRVKEAKDSSHGPWGVSLRGGLAFYSQHLNNTAGVITSGKFGPIVEGEFQYDVTESFVVGLGTEWERHTARVNLGVGKVGTINTVSILPFVRYQFIVDQFHPYFNVGFGYNINSFDLANVIAGIPTAGLVTSIGNSFSVKPGVGMDYFFSDSWAFNAEFDWKWNTARFTANVVQVPYVGRIDLNMSSWQGLVGARYFF